MLDIPDSPILEKGRIIGGCVRLAATVDADRLRQEIAQLPPGVWSGTGGRVGVHRPAGALFLRGYAPAEGDKPVADRAALAELPYTRSIIEEIIPAPRLRCLLARLPAGASIAPHVDRPPYFAKTLRIHVPVETNDQVHMWSRGLSYRMRAGEVWVLNNSAPHAVWNAHSSSSRTHLICDFLPSAALLDLLATGARHLGERLAEVDEHFGVSQAMGFTAAQ